MNLLVVSLLVQTLSFIKVQSLESENNEVVMENLPEVHGDKFYYFGYGSNMLSKRIHLLNPSAVKIGKGTLIHHRLDFNFISPRWEGSVATVVEHLNSTVQGTLWELELTNLNSLDQQEGVHEGIYKPISVSVLQLDNRKIITARLYVLVKQPATDLKELDRESMPLDRQPSKTYLKCLVKGASESNIEHSYIEWLKTIKHNGNVVEYFENLLDLKDVKLST